MKKTLLFLCALLTLSAAFFNFFTMEYVILYEGNVISYVIGDADNDGFDDLLLIRRAFSQNGGPEGEFYGDYLYQLPYGGTVTGMKKILKRYKLEDVKPLKVMLGDVNGDGLNDVSVIVYKTAEFHNIMAKRPFFYNIKNRRLNPLWLGSRLSHPFTDYLLFDIDNDGACDIISSEMLSDGKMAVYAYRWLSFGFEMFAKTGDYETVSRICVTDDGKLEIETDKKNGTKLFYSDGKLIEEGEYEKK